MDEEKLELQELEPSPVDETPASTKPDDYFPNSTSPSQSSSRKSTTTLGLSSHSLTFYLHRTQKYSTYAFSLFAGLHIINTSLLPLLTRSLPTSDTYLLLTRPYYQSPLLEPLLIGLPLTLHIISGIALRLHRRRAQLVAYGAETRSDRKRLPWPKLSGTSILGYTLLPLLSAHVFVNRVLPLKVLGGSSDVGLRYVGHGFAKLPALSFVAYTALVGVAVWHGVWGWARWVGGLPEQVRGTGPERVVKGKRRWYLINGIAGMVAAIWLAGGLGVVGRGGEVAGWLGREYDGLYGRLPLVGRWIG
ncbi:MAG: hypothetical protein M1820_005793 [Bogoriella megaspora]|nr:MAG: hypothetical protein M1820_005793 [Bogoriella megaspora]